MNKIGDFLIVAPEGKATFYINSADKKVLYSDFFLHEFLPSIEKKYSIRKDRKNRAISGVSMGGYGALRFAFAHPELFGSVSAQSPHWCRNPLIQRIHSDDSWARYSATRSTLPTGSRTIRSRLPGRIRLA